MSKVRSELPSVVIVQLLTNICLFETPCTAACQASLSFTISWNFLKFMSFELVMLSNHLILHFPLFLCLSVFPRNSLFQWVSSLHQVVKVLMLQLQHQSFFWVFRLTRFGLLADQGTLKSLLQHHNSKASILVCLAFFTIHLSHPYMCVLVIQLCPTLCNLMDCNPPGSSVHVILQARILEWGAIPFSRGSSWPRDQTWISWTAGRFFIIWATREEHDCWDFDLYRPLLAKWRLYFSIHCLGFSW